MTSSSYLGNGLMAARLATLGALGAEGTVLCVTNSWSLAHRMNDNGGSLVLLPLLK